MWSNKWPKNEAYVGCLYCLASSRTGQKVIAQQHGENILHLLSLFQEKKQKTSSSTTPASIGLS